MLFADSEVFGTFKGFNERGLEFAAEIVSLYDASMLDRPQLGQFLLIELGSQEEAALGRITRFVPAGLLAGPEGEDYVNTMQRRQSPVPEDLKRQRLKYRVQVKLLGAVRVDNGRVVYVPSQRRLPHLGARVALPSGVVLQELCRLSRGKTDLGDYVLGEFVYGGAGLVLEDPTFRTLDPKLVVTFDVRRLVSRRSVVFARAGYGKSNLMKYLLSELYREAPKTDSGIDVGTLIFDADGEYLLSRQLEESSPFVEWVKEGRKYDLGAILITQQPGSIASEILSQADNWFCFHLLSEGDAGTLGKYNAHFSDDVLAHLIAEPIPGNCFMWSAPHQPFVLPVRVRNLRGAIQEIGQG